MRRVSLCTLDSDRAGEVKGLPSSPAFVWVPRSSVIHDFLCLYRDLAYLERNLWACAHLDRLIDDTEKFQKRMAASIPAESSVLHCPHCDSVDTASEGEWAWCRACGFEFEFPGVANPPLPGSVNQEVKIKIKKDNYGR